jgi:riboflavin biosynthesis pyrimidine reductase
MRQLLPAPLDDVDLYDALRPASDVVRLNMVASADGAVVDADGRSGSIGGDGDREVFRTLRAHADVIVAGAGTVRDEGYGPHRVAAHLRERRAADGRSAPAAVAVVSRSLDLDWEAPLFTEAVTPTIVLTCASADPSRQRRAASAGVLIVAGGDAVDPAAAIAALRAHGARSVLCEGGPSLNAAWLGAGVVDELCLTIAPALLGETGPRLAGDLGRRVDVGLRAIIADGDELYLRYAISR